MSSYVILTYVFGLVIVHMPNIAFIGVGVWLVWGVWKKEKSYKLLLACWSFLFLACSSPLPCALVQSLENQARKMAPKALPYDFDGFVLLGGCFSECTTIKSERPIYNNIAGSRLFDFVLLAKDWPTKRIVLTGTDMESVQMKRELVRFGIEEARITIEDQSANTRDNAVKTFDLIHPEGSWVLVTSAFHIKRSALLFKQAGWRIIPWPVGFLLNNQSVSWFPDLRNSVLWPIGIKEMLGIWYLKLGERRV